MIERHALLADTMIELADNLVADFDVVDTLTVLATRCVEVLGIASAGVMLAGPDGALRVIASSSEAMRVLELFEVQAAEGPCMECYESGEIVHCETLEAALDRWPEFAPLALADGFRSVQALPMRLRDRVIGALNLFSTEAELLAPDVIRAAQALADIATIAILQHRSAMEIRLLNDQLSHALNSRIIIEQAKGILANRQGIEVAEAFELLRQQSRRANSRLVDVAAAVVAGEWTP